MFAPFDESAGISAWKVVVFDKISLLLSFLSSDYSSVSSFKSYQSFNVPLIVDSAAPGNYWYVLYWVIIIPVILD